MKSSITKLLLGMICLMYGQLNLQAQKVKYSDIEKEDSKNLNVEIIGKFANKIIIYKNFRTENIFSVYDTDMKLVERIKLTSLPNKLINPEFINYNSHFYMIYQYQKKNVLYCEAIKFDQNAKKMEETIELDTTKIGSFESNNKIYNVLVSDNKQKIAIVKANKKSDRNHFTGVVMYDANLKKQFKRFYNINIDGRNNFLDEFSIDNEGDLFIGKCYSITGNEYISKYNVLHLSYNNDTISEYTMPTDNRYIDDIMFKVDNVNKKVLVQGLYLTKKRGNIEGMYTGIFSKANPKSPTMEFNSFDDTLRVEAKGINNTKMAFNDFFIKQILPKKDGSYIIIAESSYTTTRNNMVPWSRWDFYNATPYLTNFDYYNMGSGRSWYGNSWNRWDRFNNGTIYYAENIAVLSFNKNGLLEWGNVVHKNQKDEGTEEYISYQSMLLNGGIHFFYNERDRQTFLLSSNSVDPNGNLTRHPPLKNLDRQYELMPRQGKQISAREILMPCLHKNYICFAKIEF